MTCSKSPTIGEGWPTKLGLQYAKTDIMPQINITNYYALGPNSPSKANYRENIFNESDVADDDPRPPQPPLRWRIRRFSCRLNSVG